MDVEITLRDYIIHYKDALLVVNVVNMQRIDEQYIALIVSLQNNKKVSAKYPRIAMGRLKNLQISYFSSLIKRRLIKINFGNLFEL
jgi:hypothetical protein